MTEKASFGSGLYFDLWTNSEEKQAVLISEEIHIKSRYIWAPAIISIYGKFKEIHLFYYSDFAVSDKIFLRFSYSVF